MRLWGFMGSNGFSGDWVMALFGNTAVFFAQCFLYLFKLFGLGISSDKSQFPRWIRMGSVSEAMPSGGR